MLEVVRRVSGRVRFVLMVCSSGHRSGRRPCAGRRRLGSRRAGSPAPSWRPALVDWARATAACRGVIPPRRLSREHPRGVTPQLVGDHREDRRRLDGERRVAGVGRVGRGDDAAGVGDEVRHARPHRAGAGSAERPVVGRFAPSTTRRAVVDRATSTPTCPRGPPGSGRRRVRPADPRRPGRRRACTVRQWSPRSLAAATSSARSSPSASYAQPAAVETATTTAPSSCSRSAAARPTAPKPWMATRAPRRSRSSSCAAASAASATPKPVTPSWSYGRPPSARGSPVETPRSFSSSTKIAASSSASPMSRPNTYSRRNLAGQSPGERTQDPLLVRAARVAEDAGLGAAVEQVDSGPLPGHGAGKTSDLPHRQRRAHPGATLAQPPRGVVDHQHAPHARPTVGDQHDLLWAPLVDQLEQVMHRRRSPRRLGNVPPESHGSAGLIERPTTTVCGATTRIPYARYRDQGRSGPVARGRSRAGPALVAGRGVRLRARVVVGPSGLAGLRRLRPGTRPCPYWPPPRSRRRG